MYILTVTYPTGDGATFDHAYYRQTHLPMVGKAFRPHGLGYASVLKGEASTDGGPPAYFAYALFSFATEAGARAALADPAAGGLISDIANFTNVTPVMQFNTAID